MTGVKTNPVAREIRVFISSTFRDMQAERDHLINRVFPALSREAERRNVTILPVDLRWGITEEEASQGSVVGICLEQIDQSRPFFIGLIGHRYGWCPGYDDVASASDRCPRLGMYVDHGLSMTEIEMQYGVLDSDSDTDALFMIKADQPGCVPDPGILRLRDKVSLRRPSDTVTYSSVEQLGECVRQRMIELLDRYYPATEQSMETAVSDIMWGQAEKEASVYIDQHSLTEAPLSNHLVRVYQAPPGEGRSAYAASRAVTLREDSGLAVVYFRTGNDTAVENKNKFLTVLRHQLAVAAGVNDDPVLQRLGFADVVEYLCSRLKSCGRTPVFIIDGAECMQYISAFEWRRELLLPLVANGCYVEVTLPVGESFRAIRELFMYPYQDMRAELIEIPALSPESRCRYISMHLAKFGKRLPSQIVEYLATKPITMRELRFVLDEMLVYGVFETLPNYIDRLLALESMSDRYMHVLHRITGMIPVAEISPLLAVLAVACHGVPEFELWHDILHWTPLRWAEVYGLMRNIISRSSTGLVADLDLKDLLKSITTADDRQAASVAIAAALDGKHNHDAECAVQLYRSGQHDKLWSLLANDGATLNILSAGDDHTPYTYWNFLLHKDPYKYSFTPVSESAYNVSQALTLLKFNHNYFRNAEFVLEIYNRFDRDLFDTDDVDIWNYLLEIMPVPSRIDWLESIAVGRSIPAKNMLAAHYIDAGKMDVAADWIEKAIDDWRFVSVSDRYRSMYLADGVNMYLTRAYMWFRFGKIDKARADLDAADALAPRVCADTLSHSRAVAARCVIDFLWAYREGMDFPDIDLANEAVGRFAELTGYVRSALGDKNPHTLEFERAFCLILLVYGDDAELAIDEWCDAILFSDIPVRWRDELLIGGALPVWLTHIPGIDDYSLAERITDFYCRQMFADSGRFVGAAAYWNNKHAFARKIDPAETVHGSAITEARCAIVGSLTPADIISGYVISSIWPDTVRSYPDDRFYELAVDSGYFGDSKLTQAWTRLAVLYRSYGLDVPVSLHHWMDASGVDGMIEGIYEKMIQLYLIFKRQFPKLFDSVDIFDFDSLLSVAEHSDAPERLQESVLDMLSCLYELEGLFLYLERKSL